MDMKNLKLSKGIPFYAIVLLFGFALLFNWLFYTERTVYKELKSVKSPYDNVVLVGYLGNCGATCPWSIKVRLETPDGKLILDHVFLAFHCEAVDIEWLDRVHARINGVVLDVFKDRLDDRVDRHSVCPQNP